MIPDTKCISVNDVRGFALPAVLFAMVILGILAVTNLATTGDERQAASGVMEGARGFYAAEAGLNAVLANWDSLRYDTLIAGAGDSLLLGWQTIPENGSGYRAVIHRVDTGGRELYTLNVDGRSDGAWGGRRTLSMLVTEASVNIDAFAQAAVTTTSNMELVSDATATIDGNDTPPPGWPCDLPGDPRPGVSVNNMTGMSQGPGTILGDPPVAVDPTINAASFTQFGDVTYADMVALATKNYPGGSEPSSFGPALSGGACDTSVNNNWGDPLNPGAPCFDYFPIIHFAGDVEFTTSGSAGQGILLVDGDLAVGGGDFTFFGLIIVQGGCVFEYQSRVYGGILCANQGSVNQEIGDAAPLSYSSCSLGRALNGAGLGGDGFIPVSGSWMELSR